MEANELHLSRRSIRWKSKTTNGDHCKYKVYELMGTRRKDRARTLLDQCLILP